MRDRIADTGVPRSIRGFSSTCTDIAVRHRSSFQFKKCKSIHNTDIAVPIAASIIIYIIASVSEPLRRVVWCISLVYIIIYIQEQKNILKMSKVVYRIARHFRGQKFSRFSRISFKPRKFCPRNFCQLRHIVNMSLSHYEA